MFSFSTILTKISTEIHKNLGLLYYGRKVKEKKKNTVM